MKPLQVWLPEFTSSLGFEAHRRDMQRAFNLWNCEAAVWFLPEAKESLLWNESPKGLNRPDLVRAIPAEHLDHVKVHHVGSRGFVHGPRGLEFRFPRGTVIGLLESLLNMPPKTIGLHLTPKSIPAILPSILDGKPCYHLSAISLTPTGMWPIVSVEKESQTFTSKWPPAESPFAPISPDAEAAEMYGPMKWGSIDGIPHVYSEADPSVRGLATLFKWPAPFDSLMSFCDGDHLMDQMARLTACVKESQSNPAKALMTARDAAATYTKPGWTLVSHGWLLPLMLEGEIAARSALDARFDIEDTPLLEALQRSDIQEALDEKMPIDRVWGVMGLMWNLLVEQLETGAKFKSCELCGRVIKGSKSKRHCGREDSVECLQARAAKYKRKSRRSQN